MQRVSRSCPALGANDKEHPMTDDTNTDAKQAPNPGGAPELLDRLVGTWQNSGPDNLDGQVTYEWMPGGGFLNSHELTGTLTKRDLRTEPARAG
jgi:hypothetical protein